MTTTFQSYEHWRHDLDDNDVELWEHLDNMESGNEGSFCQALFAALNRADGSNARRLYNAFPHLFNPN